jgi:hypothetical protein
MILGQSRATGILPRRVRLYDYLHVHGTLEADNICAGVPFRIGAGKTPMGNTAWQVYGPTGIFVDVPTGAAGFTQTPIYVVSIGGTRGTGRRPVGVRRNQRGLSNLCALDR